MIVGAVLRPHHRVHGQLDEVGAGEDVRLRATRHFQTSADNGMLLVRAPPAWSRVKHGDTLPRARDREDPAASHSTIFTISRLQAQTGQRREHKWRRAHVDAGVVEHHASTPVASPRVPRASVLTRAACGTTNEGHDNRIRTDRHDPELVAMSSPRGGRLRATRRGVATSTIRARVARGGGGRPSGQSGPEISPTATTAATPHREHSAAGVDLIRTAPGRARAPGGRRSPDEVAAIGGSPRDPRRKVTATTITAARR